MKRILSMALILALCILFVSCGDADYEELTANLPPSEKIAPVETDIESAPYEFAAKLLCQSFDGGDTLISPASLMAVLAMCSNGAEGETAAELEKLLGYDTKALNDYFYNIVSKDDGALRMANSLWVNENTGFEPKEPFLTACKNYYGASVFSSPFTHSTKKDVNGWVKDNTDGMIEKIVDDVSPDTVMLLVNALSFENEWEEIYLSDCVHEDFFTALDGSSYRTEYMYGEEGLFLESENAKGFIKYYKDRKYSYVAILPNEDLTLFEYLESLSGEELYKMISEPRDASVLTMLPKYESSFSAELSEVFKEMGARLPFDPEKANFSKLGTVEGENIFISRVFHKTYISVAEKGTRAGAASAIQVEATSAAPEDRVIETVYLTRPFVYMIIETESLAPLFIGTVTAP